MVLRRWFERSIRLRGAPGGYQLTVDRDEWRQIAETMAAAAGRLISIWASKDSHDRDVMHAAFLADAGLMALHMPLESADSHYPSLAQLYPAANRMQRAISDLSGLRTTDADTRPWLRHAAWPASFHPLKDAHTPAPQPLRFDDYAFVRVQGEGVHEIPVGPVHAGVIEPGHFRFSLVGEKVLKLEERFGYAHKGVERRFSQLSLQEGSRLAARISGDSAVAFSWAYCQALEGAADAVIPPRAAWLRALALEIERTANHLGDVGALGNDAGFAFGLSQFSRLKEELLRASAAAFGQRYLMDFIEPGGVRADLTAIGGQRLAETIESIADETETLRAIYDEHAGVRDRFTDAGVVTPALALQLGLAGLAGRASGQNFDLRVDLPCDPYRNIAPKKFSRSEGDVGARVAVRFDELKESARLVRILLKHMPAGLHASKVQTPRPGAMGIGLIEGWRGPVFVALEAGADGAIRRCHPHDCSWQNWPVVEHAAIDNIVADFPLINKSFNLAYSGHDL